MSFVHRMWEHQINALVGAGCRCIAGVRRDRLAFLDGFFPNFYNSDANYPGVSADLMPYSKSIAWVASPFATQTIPFQSRPK